MLLFQYMTGKGKFAKKIVYEMKTVINCPMNEFFNLNLSARHPHKLSIY